MSNRLISETQYKKYCFPNYTYYDDTEREDDYFMATAIYMLHDCLPVDEGFNLGFYSVSGLAGDGINAIKKKLRGDNLLKNSIKIFHVNCPEEQAKEQFEQVEPSFLGRQWCHDEKSSQFISLLFPAGVYVNAAKNSTAIITARSDKDATFVLQGPFPKYLPKFFKRNLQDSGKKLALLKAASNLNYAVWDMLIDDFIEQGNFDEKIGEAILANAGGILLAGKIRSIRENIRHAEERLTEFYREIQELVDEKREHETRLLGYETFKKDAVFKSFADYMLVNKKITVFAGEENNVICYNVTDTLDYFNSEAAESLLDNSSSVLYGRSGYSPAWKAFLEALFVKASIKVKVFSRWKIDRSGAINIYADSEPYKNCIPHPHIMRYTCLGGNEAEIARCSADFDLIGAVEQTIAATKNLNILDPLPTKYLMEQLGSCMLPCIVLPDGEEVTVDEAIEWVKSQNNENGEEVSA